MRPRYDSIMIQLQHLLFTLPVRDVENESYQRHCVVDTSILGRKCSRFVTRV